MRTSLLAVLGHDGPGIIASVTSVLFQTRCNLEDISMTVLEGELAMMMVVSYEPSLKKKLDEKIAALSKKSKLSFFWKDIKVSRGSDQTNARNHLYLISAIGRDRTGIVYHISQDLAAEKMNILDLNSRILARHSKKSIYAMVLEVEIPKKYPIEHLRRKLEKTAAKLKIDLTLKPVERLEL